MITDRFPLKDSAPVEAEARDLGYPSNDVIACRDCEGTGYCWYRFDPSTQAREPCVSCGARGYVPRVNRYAFLGSPVPYDGAGN